MNNKMKTYNLIQNLDLLPELMETVELQIMLSYIKALNRGHYKNSSN